MTRKDYELIARVFSTNRKWDTGIGDEDRRECALRASSRICEDLADALKADNPRFDRERFLKACGVTE